MFLYSRWLALPLSTRVKIAKELGISKSGSTHVQDNVVVNDGYDIKTVEAALEAHQGDWDEIVAKAEGRAPVSVGGDGTGAVIFASTGTGTTSTMTVSGTAGTSISPPINKTKSTRAATKPKKGK